LSDLKTFIVQLVNGSFNLTDRIGMMPSILIEKKNVFHVISSKPFSHRIYCELPGCGCRTNSFVWISHQKKAIYFENPKAGSSSVKRLLGIKPPSLLNILLQLYFEWHKVGEFELVIRDYNHNLLPDYIQQTCEIANGIIAQGSDYINHPELINPVPNQSDFQQYYGSADNVLELYSAYFSFAFVREPMSRFLSNYRMFVQKNNRNLQLTALTRKEPDSLSLDDFIQIVTDFHNHHWNPQFCFLPQNLEKLHLLINMEDYNEGIKEIGHRLGLYFVPVNINSTDKSETKSDVISLDQEGAIRALYIDDYKRFNF